MISESVMPGNDYRDGLTKSIQSRLPDLLGNSVYKERVSLRESLGQKLGLNERHKDVIIPPKAKTSMSRYKQQQKEPEKPTPAESPKVVSNFLQKQKRQHLKK